jgi:large subunit ribosomal protein L24
LFSKTGKIKMALHVKKGDTVEIITGDHSGAVGKVLRVLPKDNKVVVQGHNLVKKHVKPSRKNPQGGRISVEQAIHISNVLPVSPKTSKGSRVSYQIDEKGAKRRITSDGSEIGVVRKAK